MKKANRRFLSRLFRLAVILLAAFWLRAHALQVSDFSLDESWSFLHAHAFVFPEDHSAIKALAVEPNNAFHLVLVSPWIVLIESQFGLRWLSVMCGVLAVALTARLAYRLSGRRVAFAAALIVAFALVPIQMSQNGRPYALSVMLALLSLMFWLENKWGLNLIASIGLTFTHIGAFPVVMLQDVLMIPRMRKPRFPWFHWISNRILVYGVFLAVLVMMLLRRLGGKIMSAGQTPPTLGDIITDIFNNLHSGYTGDVNMSQPFDQGLFLVGFVLPILIMAVIMLVFRRQRPKSMGILTLWVVITYGSLAVMAIVSDGPIKYLHITHVIVAVAILAAIILTAMPRPAMLAVLGIYLVANGISLFNYYTHPFTGFSDTIAVLETLRQPDEPVYMQHETAGWALTLNVPDAEFLEILPDPDKRPDEYLYLGYSSWQPPTPPECDTRPIWNNWPFHVHHCQRSTDEP